MPQTLFDKIWDSHLVARRADGRDLIYIDRHVLHELHGPHAFEKLAKANRPVRRPDLTFSMQDHTIATLPGRDDTTNPQGTDFIRATRAESRHHGIRLFDLGAIAAWHLNAMDRAVEWGQKALDLDPGNQRLNNNQDFFLRRREEVRAAT